MADDSAGKSIADAYRNRKDDSAAAAPSAGASIADAYRAQAASAPPPAKSWQDEYFPAPDVGDIQPDPRVTAALGRVGEAVAEGWRGGTMQTPAAYAENQRTLVGQYVTNPLVEFGNLPFRALGALGRGGAQAIYEAGEPAGRAMPEVSIPNITLPGDSSITYPGGITIDRPGRGFGGTVLGGPGLGRDLNLLSQVIPVAGDMRAPGAMRPPVAPEVSALSPAFASERSAPPRPPGMTDAARINQLVEHAVNEEQPAVGPPMARGPATQEPPPVVTGGGGATPPASPVGSAPSGGVPMTSDAAKAVATAYYKTFDRAAQDGGSLTPQATNKFIASVEAAAPKPGIGQAVAGKNTITDLVERLQDYKNQPMSLEDAHIVDKQLGNLITAEYSKTGVSDIGRELQNIQHTFRDQLSNPEAGDVVSGQAGLDALAPARKAYSQAMKLDTIERIQERANMTDNPSTSFRTQVRTLLNNDRRSRGFSDEEKDALRAAANRGAAATALHVLGSRLIPIISGSTGTGAGFFGAGPVGASFGATAGATAGHLLNEAARAGENALAARRLQNAYTVLGKSVPPNPLQGAPP